MGIMPHSKGKKRSLEEAEEMEDSDEEDEEEEDEGGSDVEQDEAEIAALQVCALPTHCYTG